MIIRGRTNQFDIVYFCEKFQAFLQLDTLLGRVWLILEYNCFIWTFTKNFITCGLDNKFNGGLHWIMNDHCEKIMLYAFPINNRTTKNDLFSFSLGSLHLTNDDHLVWRFTQFRFFSNFLAHFALTSHVAVNIGPPAVLCQTKQAKLLRAHWTYVLRNRLFIAFVIWIRASKQSNHTWHLGPSRRNKCTAWVTFRGVCWIQTRNKSYIRFRCSGRFRRLVARHDGYFLWSFLSKSLIFQNTAINQFDQAIWAKSKGVFWGCFYRQKLPYVILRAVYINWSVTTRFGVNYSA